MIVFAGFLIALAVLAALIAVAACDVGEPGASLVVALIAVLAAVLGGSLIGSRWSKLYTCEQAQLEPYERREIDSHEEQCMPDGYVWRLPSP